METGWEKFVWLVGGVLLGILSQNFINDPIKDWRARRSKQYARQRITELKTSIKLLEEGTTDQKKVALEVSAAISDLLNLLFFILQFSSGILAMLSLGQFVSLLRREDTVVGLISVGGIVSGVSLFFVFDHFRKIAIANRNFAHNVVNFESYKAVVNGQIKDLEQRALR